MAYRLPGGRVTLTPAEGCPVELEPITAPPVYQTAVGLFAALYAAETPAAEFDARAALYGYFCIEAQPTWQIIDHRGVVPPTPAGMMRLPFALDIVTEWAEAFVAEPLSTAVDEVYPPGPLRDQLNAKLRAVS